MPDNNDDIKKPNRSGLDAHAISENPRPKPVRLGEYSTDPDIGAREDRERQASVVKRVGDYLLTQHPVWPHKYTASHIDGKPVPKGLTGLWHLSAFEQALRREKGQVENAG